MTYRVIITGSRKYAWRHRVDSYLDRCLAYHSDLVVVTGGCETGADAQAGDWARDHKTPLEVYAVPDEAWERHGGAAGPMRNSHMLHQGADEVGAFWLPTRSKLDNRGTKDLCIKAWRAGVPVFACWGDSASVPWHGKLFATLR